MEWKKEKIAGISEVEIFFYFNGQALRDDWLSVMRIHIQDLGARTIT